MGAVKCAVRVNKSGGKKTEAQAVIDVYNTESHYNINI